MPYNPVSITKVPEGAGCPTPKHPTVTLIPVEIVEAEPTREIGNVIFTGDLSLVTGKNAINIFAQPSTIEVTEETDGDAGVRGVKSGVIFEHPGDSAAAAGFTEYARNRGFIGLVRDCDGNGTERKYIGSVCNPLYLTSEYTNNKDARKRKLTFKQEQRDPRGIGVYRGQMPDVAPEATEPVIPPKQEGA